MRLSIVIPVLNERAALPATLAALAPMRGRGVDVIVADGGSDDGTPILAAAAADRVLAAPRGRAAQMNAGAGVATGDVLLFLHADTRLPADADRLVLARLGQGRHVWGRFDVRIDGGPWMLRVIAWAMNRRSRLSGIATGDQAIFVTRRAFDAVGGFPDQPLMEDIELSKRLRAICRPLCLREKAVTSGRRWQSRGLWRTMFLMWRLRWAYARGVPADKLARAYR